MDCEKFKGPQSNEVMILNLKIPRGTPDLAQSFEGLLFRSLKRSMYPRRHFGSKLSSIGCPPLLGSTFCVIRGWRGRTESGEGLGRLRRNLETMKRQTSPFHICIQLHLVSSFIEMLQNTSLESPNPATRAESTETPTSHAIMQQEFLVTVRHT